jgi:hypothetical protein
VNAGVEAAPWLQDQMANTTPPFTTGTQERQHDGHAAQREAKRFPKEALNNFLGEGDIQHLAFRATCHSTART